MICYQDRSSKVCWPVFYFLYLFGLGKGKRVIPIQNSKFKIQN
ncbi:hypothetical protein FDUTEX481_05741 [Tolypothrix sp. PCC 7601]|nr:hypothetical protein FDUTEX481_05741 [Tolypothrix sp. PCC 7601]